MENNNIPVYRKAVLSAQDASEYTNIGINKIKEIEGGRILLLYDDFFVILNLKSKKQICLIKVNFERKNTGYDNTIFYDFIELKNRNLIIWSRKKILHYKKSGDNYELKQVINELEQQYNQTTHNFMVDSLCNVIELENNALLSCNSIGIKIYNYIENKYKLVKIIHMFLSVVNLIKIKDNNFLVVHHVAHTSGTCIPDTYHEFALSLFDLKSNQITKIIFYHKTERNYWSIPNYIFNYFLLGCNFIYQICDFPYDLEEIERRKNNKNSLSANYNIYNIIDGKNVINLKTSFLLIDHFKDNLLFAQL